MSRAFCRYSRGLRSISHSVNLLRQPRTPPISSRIRRISSTVQAAELRFGQPLHETHPHLLKAGEGRTDLYFETKP